MGLFSGSEKKKREKGVVIKKKKDLEIHFELMREQQPRLAVSVEDFTAKFTSQLLDVINLRRKSYIVMDYVMPMDANRLLTGRRIALDYSARNGEFSFDSEVVDETTFEGNPAWRIKFPKLITSSFRNFFRVRPAPKEPIEVVFFHCPRYIDGIHGKVLDICEEGVRFKFNMKDPDTAGKSKSVTEGMEIPSVVLNLPTGDSIKTTALVKRRGKEEAALQLTGVTDTQRDQIRFYVYKRELEMSGKAEE